MKKRYLASTVFTIIGIGFTAGFVSAAGIYEIEFTGSEVFTSGQNASLATTYVDASSSDTQTSAIYGAGFTMNGPTVLFNADLYSWDSYSDPNGSGNTGWWDGFFVNVNQEGYYWDIISGYSDPLVDSSYAGGTPTTGSVLPGATWAWGGATFGDGLESFKSDVTSFISLTLPSFDNTKSVYVSFVLDTLTDPNEDSQYASWGNFQAQAAVPEPTTMLLFGAGLAGLAGMSRRKKK